MLAEVSSRDAADTHIQSVPRLDVSALEASKLRQGESVQISHVQLTQPVDDITYAGTQKLLLLLLCRA
jgi:hypothetical protein